MAAVIRNVLTGVARRVARRLGVEVRPMPVAVEDVIGQMVGAQSVKMILDVGANQGRTVLRYARLFPSATIHGFEPFPEAYAQLCAMTSDMDRIITHRTALGAVAGNQDLCVNQNCYTNSLLANSDQIDRYAPDGWTDPVGTVSVPVTTLASFCRENQIDTIDLLKIDTQGYELRVLEGAGEMLSPERVRFAYLELNFVSLYEGQAPYDKVVSYMHERGYRLFNLFDAAVDPSSGMKWADALFVGA